MKIRPLIRGLRLTTKDIENDFIPNVFLFFVHFFFENPVF
jgi:hypothetical protein